MVVGASNRSQPFNWHGAGLRHQGRPALIAHHVTVMHKTTISFMTCFLLCSALSCHASAAILGTLFETAVFGFKPKAMARAIKYRCTLHHMLVH